MNKEMEDEYWKLKTEKTVQKLKSMEQKKEERLQKKEESVQTFDTDTTNYDTGIIGLGLIGLAGAAAVCSMMRKTQKKVRR